MITVLAERGTIVVGEMITVSESEEHHLAVRRASPAVAVRVVDGAGTIGWGPLGLKGRFAAVTIERTERVLPPAPVILAVGAGDRDRFVGLIEKVVELGVTRIIPIETARSLSVANRLRDKHMDKVMMRAQEAVKQSGNPWLPELVAPVSLELFLAGDLPDHRWLADLQGGTPGPIAPLESLAIAVGPEGGFTDAERTQLSVEGFEPVALGPYVLRFDTAAVAALTLANHLRRPRPS
jgi:16S rRNA (uracil1498-N3)-methyltransferase